MQAINISDRKRSGVCEKRIRLIKHEGLRSSRSARVDTRKTFIVIGDTRGQEKEKGFDGTVSSIEVQGSFIVLELPIRYYGAFF